MYEIIPLTPLGQADVAPAMSLQEMFTWVKMQCHQRFDQINPDFCNAIFPLRPTYLPPPRERSYVKWYWWLAAGYLAGKIL